MLLRNKAALVQNLGKQACPFLILVRLRLLSHFAVHTAADKSFLQTGKEC